MSIVFCDYCSQYVDLDTNAEHYTPQSELKVCVQEAEDNGWCLNCGNDSLEVEAIDYSQDEVYYYCERCDDGN